MTGLYMQKITQHVQKNPVICGLSKVTGHKINIQKSIACLHTKNEHGN